MHTIFRYRRLSLLYAVSFVLVVAGFARFFFSMRESVSPTLILHIDALHGITQLGGWETVYFMEAWGMVTIFMNYAISIAVMQRKEFFGMFFAVMTLGFSILLFIAFTVILDVNV